MAQTVHFATSSPGLLVSTHVGEKARLVEVEIPPEGLDLDAADPLVDVLDVFCVSPAHDLTNQPEKERSR